MTNTHKYSIYSKVTKIFRLFLQHRNTFWWQYLGISCPAFLWPCISEPQPGNSEHRTISLPTLVDDKLLGFTRDAGVRKISWVCLDCQREHCYREILAILPTASRYVQQINQIPTTTYFTPVICMTVLSVTCVACGTTGCRIKLVVLFCVVALGTIYPCANSSKTLQHLPNLFCLRKMNIKLQNTFLSECSKKT